MQVAIITLCKQIVKVLLYRVTANKTDMGNFSSFAKSNSPKSVRVQA